MIYLKHAMLPGIILGMILIVTGLSACQETKEIHSNVDQSKAAIIAAKFR